jgi:hypothetical protein
MPANFQSNVFPPGAAQGQFNALPPVVLTGNSTILQLDNTGRLLVASEANKYTYRAAITGLTPVATPTDFVQMIGSATMTCRLKKLKLTGIATTAGTMPVNIVRRSTLGTQGSAVVTAITPSKHDINHPAATMSIGYVGTANWTTPGTSAGLIGADRLQLVLAGTYAQGCVFDFAFHEDMPILLRGISDYVYINLTGAAVPSGGAIDIEIEWEEDNS